MTALITSQRYNWMGYNGTETEEVDTALLRLDPNSKGSNFDYAHRQEVIADIKERLYLIKRDLDLIPEEELRAEEEARQARREARKQREAEEARRREEEERRRAEEAERRRLEQEQREEEERLRQAQEEERRRAEEAEAEAKKQRWQGMGNSDEDSEDEEERNDLLTRMPRTQEEIDHAVTTFTAGTRVLLASRGQGYVSYLDGSFHTSIAVLEQYNNNHLASVENALRDTEHTIPDAEEYNTAELRETLEARNEARKNLDARRVENDPTYAARLRRAERENLRTVPPEEGDEEELLQKVEAAKAKHEEVRAQYNDRATACGRALVTAAASRVEEGSGPQPAAAPAEEGAAPADEGAAAEASAPPPEETGIAADRAVDGEEAPKEASAAGSSKKGSSKKSSPKFEEEGEYPTEEPAKAPSTGSKKSNNDSKKTGSQKASSKTSSKSSSKKSSPKNDEYPVE